MYSKNAWWRKALANSHQELLASKTLMNLCLFVFIIVHTSNGFGYQCASRMYCSHECVCMRLVEPMICRVGIMSVNLSEKNLLMAWRNHWTDVVVGLYCWRRPFEPRKSWSESFGIQNTLKLLQDRHFQLGFVSHETLLKIGGQNSAITSDLPNSPKVFLLHTFTLCGILCCYCC